MPLPAVLLSFVLTALTELVFCLLLEVVDCLLARVVDGEEGRKWETPPFILAGEGDRHGERAMATNGFYKGIE